MVFFIAYGGNIYQLMGYGVRSSWSGNGDLVFQSIRTFREETDTRVLAVQGARLEIVEVPRSMFFTEFLKEFPSSVPDQEILNINRIVADERLNRGMLIKRVVGGQLP